MPGSGVSLHAWWNTKREHPNAQTTLQMRSSDMYPIDTHYMIGNEEEPGESLLSLRPELLSNFLLPCILSVERWIPLLEQCAEPHSAGTVLVACTAIKTTVAREEVREGTFYWIDGSTLLSTFGFILLCISTKRTSNLISTSISKTMLLIWRQRIYNRV